MNPVHEPVAGVRQLVLASSSRYRRDLLERYGLAFKWASPDIDERRLSGESPRALVRRLGEAKAAAVAGDLVIGSDQIAVVGDEIFGKPHTVAAAEQQLRALSGREVEFLTSVAVRSGESGTCVSEIVPVVVAFRHLSPADIATYVAIERPLDCAGGFKCEGLGITLFERIESDDPTALTGLPLIALARLLRRQGFDVLAELSAQRGDVR
jgi:septum formation protein